MTFPTKTEYLTALKEHQIPKVLLTKPKIEMDSQKNIQRITLTFTNYHPSKLLDYLNNLNMINPTNMIKFIYNYKQHRVDYNNNLARRHMYTTDDNWGNLCKACMDLTDYDWIKQNKRAHHVLDVDPTDFYVMQDALKIVLAYFEEQRKKYSC